MVFLASKESIISRIVSSLTKDKKLTSKEHKQAIMRARFDKTPMPIEERYKLHKGKILDNRDDNYIDLRKPKFDFTNRARNKVLVHNKRQTKNVSWTPKHNTFFDKINSERNKEIIIKSSRLIVESILKITGGNLDMKQLDNLSGFLSLVVSESLSSVFKDEVRIADSIKTFISVGKKVYKVLVYINEKYETVFAEDYKLANEDDINDFYQFKLKHVKAIRHYYGGPENMGNINSDRTEKRTSILEKFTRKNQDSIEQIENLVGEKLKDPQIITQALTCSGFAKEYNDVSNDKILDHDGLATFGDALLRALISESLFMNDPSITPGSLTDEKRMLENNPELQSIGKQLKIDTILFQRNNEINGNKKLATAIEALIGAIYLSNGHESARKFVDKYIIKQG